MKDFNSLTNNETKALFILTCSALDGMGGSRPMDFCFDSYTWVNPEFMYDQGYTEAQTRGYFSSLGKKNLIVEDGKKSWSLNFAGDGDFQILDDWFEAVKGDFSELYANIIK